MYTYAHTCPFTVTLSPGHIGCNTEWCWCLW